MDSAKIFNGGCDVYGVPMHDDIAFITSSGLVHLLLVRNCL